MYGVVLTNLRISHLWNGFKETSLTKAFGTPLGS